MNLEEKIVFAISHEGTGDNVPVVILGIPRQAWDYMKDGKTHTFDLTKGGVNVKLVMFGAKDHAEVMKLLKQTPGFVEAAGDLNKDYSIKDKKP